MGTGIKSGGRGRGRGAFHRPGDGEAMRWRRH
jgi:hypothetical protein